MRLNQVFCTQTRLAPKNINVLVVAAVEHVNWKLREWVKYLTVMGVTRVVLCTCQGNIRNDERKKGGIQIWIPPFLLLLNELHYLPFGIPQSP
jgi:hypothetical protein